MKLSDYKNYQGIDADLETSLFEYGLIWGTKKELYPDDLHFIYKVSDEKFDWAYLKKDTDIFEEYDWVDWVGFLSYIGCNKEQFSQQELSQQVFDLISYYGYEEIFGTAYNSFKVELS